MNIKKIIIQKVRDKVFEKLMETQRTHIKVSEICYNIFKLQEYMDSHILTNREVSMVFSLRSRTLRNVKNNFGMNLTCSMGCQVLESQEHWLLCKHTKSNLNTSVRYSYLYGSLQQQIELVKLFSRLEEERKEMNQDAPSPPVAQTGP